MRSSYPARFATETNGTSISVITEWKVVNYVKSVIYSDFVGVINFQDGGITTGWILSCPLWKGIQPHVWR